MGLIRLKLNLKSETQMISDLRFDEGFFCITAEIHVMDVNLFLSSFSFFVL